ncbi:uncharacterized protein LOC117654377 [Thrips palmi]|uniref:Uncharacterized protein LOC117654377 n=1 Tax=Thrips palmi TaxID=161013 RepID=A0A6P9AMR9_THRPL|nr:uncharacterized protein LOC117654377 [Thrips palmi]
MEHSYVKNTPPPDKKRRITAYCCVPQCSNYICEAIWGHTFPKIGAERKKWEVALKMGKPASASMRVCSAHFVPTDYFPGAKKRHKLFPHAVPSQNLPKRVCDKSESSPQKRQKEARRNRLHSRRHNKNNIETVSENESDVEEGGNTQDDFVCENISWDASTQANLAFSSSASLKKLSETRSLADLICDLSITNDKACQACLGTESDASTEEKKSVTLPALLDSDAKLFTFAGIHSVELLEGLIDCVSDLDTGSSANKKILPVKDRVLLTMVKIKLNMSFTAIGVLFNIGRQTCSNYFKNMAPMLARVLKVMIPFPGPEDIRLNLPRSFKKYRNTRIILDCAETHIEKSKCLKCRVLTWSQYKKNHTAKYDLGITPSGLLTEVSEPYGGRASDKLIVNQSRVLDKLDYGDAVMVDKGFQIEKECLLRNVSLIRPPFLRKKKQLSQQEALETADIARARVHVERVIQRLREYNLIKGPIPWSVLPFFHSVLLIVAGLTNLGPPVISTGRFM